MPRQLVFGSLPTGMWHSPRLGHDLHPGSFEFNEVPSSEVQIAFDRRKCGDDPLLRREIRRDSAAIQPRTCRTWGGKTTA